jgi:hypothetical protein
VKPFLRPSERALLVRSDCKALCDYLDRLVLRHDHMGVRVILQHALCVYSRKDEIAALAIYKNFVESAAPHEFASYEADRSEPTEGITELARALMPGPSYRDHLRYLHETLRPRTYLEIGVFEGRTLRLAQEDTISIGIDPSSHVLYPLPINAAIFNVTSNEFFRKHATTTLPHLGPLSLVFIDGLHLFEQALLDFINVEQYCDPEALIVIHDTLPIIELTSSRIRKTGFWCGDVWKIVACLEKMRPDLYIVNIPSFPSGITIVSHLDPSSTVLGESFGHAVNEFADQPFSECEARFAHSKATVANAFRINFRHERRNENQQGPTLEREANVVPVKT